MQHANYALWSDSEVEFLRSNYSTASTKDIVRSLGRSWPSIRGKAKCLGLLSRRTIGTRTIRLDFFDGPTDDTRAYILGLLASDGCIKDDGSINLVLQSCDGHLVRWVRDFVAPNSPAIETGGTVALRFVSRPMARSLAAFGIEPRKSHTLAFPASIPAPNVPAFLLGYFDGDGSFSICRTKAGTEYPQWSLYGLEGFLASAADTIQSGSGVRPSGPTRDPRKTSMCRLRASSDKAIVIDHWLHSCGLGLPRKSFAR